MEITIYHNPRCSKSRQTVALLQENGIEPTIIEYLTSPPSASVLQHCLDLLGMAPRQLMRQKEDIYTTLALDNPALSDAELIQVMHDNPILIERPIVICDNKAVIGRPPENVLTLIQSPPQS